VPSHRSSTPIYR